MCLSHRPPQTMEQPSRPKPWSQDLRGTTCSRVGRSESTEQEDPSLASGPALSLPLHPALEGEGSRLCPEAEKALLPAEGCNDCVGFQSAHSLGSQLHETRVSMFIFTTLHFKIPENADEMAPLDPPLLWWCTAGFQTLLWAPYRALALGSCAACTSLEGRHELSRGRLESVCTVQPKLVLVTEAQCLRAPQSLPSVPGEGRTVVCSTSHQGEPPSVCWP